MKNTDYLFAAAIIVWLWLTRERDKELPEKPKSELDRFKTNLEAQFETPWKFETESELNP